MVKHSAEKLVSVGKHGVMLTREYDLLGNFVEISGGFHY